MTLPGTHMKRLLLLCALLAVAGTASADMFTPSHSCRKPHKPYEFRDEWHVQSFQDEVERYKRCIEEFVDEQNDEAQNHQEAAGDAIDEWNRFVRFEL